MNTIKSLIVVVCLCTTAATVRGAELPEFVDILDKCESLWGTERYQELYDYIGDLAQKAPDHVPTCINLAIREGRFGEQFELSIAEFQKVTNGLNRALCEANPGVFVSFGPMISWDESVLEVRESRHENAEYRRKMFDPRVRKRMRITRWWQKPDCEFPFMLPNISLTVPPATNGAARAVKLSERKPPLPVKELEACLYDDRKTPLSFRQLKDLLDDYVAGFVAKGGIRELVENFEDNLVQVDGYYALSILMEKPQEAKVLLKAYVERDNRSFDVFGVNKAKSMALWALLQFAHDDPEIAEYLKKLPETDFGRGSRSSKNSYLDQVLKHLNEGCTRKFSPSSSK